MTSHTTGYAQIDGGKLYYEIAGEGEPLVLVHAGFLDNRMWDDQFEAFAQHYRVIRFDQRGYGKSDAAQGPVSRSSDLRQLLNHLGIERAALLGCSLGGEVALDLAIEHPDRVSSLILVCAPPTGFEMQGDPPPHLTDMIEAMQRGEIAQASELQIRIWIDGMFRQPNDVDPDVRRRASEINRSVLEANPMVMMSPPLNPLDPPAVGRLGEVRVPVLVIVGALDHPEILRAAEVMTEGIADARKVVIPDVAHTPNMEQPEAFNREVLRFLQTKNR